MRPSIFALLAALVATVAAPTAARADDSHPDYDDRLRWEVAFGGSLAGLGPHDDATDLGLYLHGGVRTRRFSAFASYERDGLSMTTGGVVADAPGGAVPAGVELDGVFQRVGLTGRVTVLTLGADPHGDLSELSSFFELFLEGGVGYQVTYWDGAGTVGRPDLEYGFAAKLYGIRIDAHRAVGLLFDLDGLATRRDGHDARDANDAAPSWYVGVRGSLSLVVTD